MCEKIGRVTPSSTDDDDRPIEPALTWRRQITKIKKRASNAKAFISQFVIDSRVLSNHITHFLAP